MKTKSNLIDYLSQKTGIPVYDEIDITLEERDKSNIRPTIWVRIDGEDLQVSYKMIKGGVKVLSVRICGMDSSYCGAEFPLDHKFDKIFYKKHRTINDFGVDVQVKPSAYKNCEGGGWYSMVDVFVIDGKEFADI